MSSLITVACVRLFEMQCCVLALHLLLQCVGVMYLSAVFSWQSYTIYVFMVFYQLHNEIIHMFAHQCMHEMFSCACLFVELRALLCVCEETGVYVAIN